MPKFILLVSVLASLIWNGPQARAADSSAESLAAVAPFINDQTVTIFRIDLAQLDVDSVVQQWLKPFAMTDDEQNILTAVVEQFDGWSRRLKAESISRFYIVVSIGYLPNPELDGRRNTDLFTRLLANSTFAIIPGASSSATDEFHKTLQEKAKQTWPGIDRKMWPDCRQIHGAAVVGMGTLLDKLDSLKPAARPEFEMALAAAENRPICVAIVPPPIFARAASEILREPFAGSNVPAGPIIANGFRWLAVGEEPNLEKFKLQVIVQSASADAAQALSAAIKNEAATLGKQLGSDAAASAAVGGAQLLSLLPEAKGDRLVLSIDNQQANVLRAVVQKIYGQGLAKVWRNQSMNQMKQIALAILNYEGNHQELPDRAIRDKNGKPLLSWRVAILPFLEEDVLYKEFHLDEPWDSEHNRQLIERMPAAYRNPDHAGMPPGHTRYLAVVGEHCAFPLDHAIKLKEISDGTSNTILVVEADPDHSVIWTKPDDFEVDLENPARGLASGSQLFNTAFADSHVETLEGSMKPQTLRAMFTRDGNEVIDRSAN